MLIKEENIEACLDDFCGNDKVTAMWIYTAEEYIYPEELFTQIMHYTMKYRPAIFPDMTYEDKLPYLRRIVPEFQAWEKKTEFMRYTQRIAEQEAQGGPQYECEPTRLPAQHDV